MHNKRYKRANRRERDRRATNNNNKKFITYIK